MITSREYPFETLNSAGDCALAVRAGIPVSALLELSSCRLAETLELLREQSEAEEGLSQNMLYITQNQVEVAKAMIDACSTAFLGEGKP